MLLPCDTLFLLLLLGESCELFLWNFFEVLIRGEFSARGVFPVGCTEDLLRGDDLFRGDDLV